MGDGTTTSKIETARLFPLTVTSPSGRIVGAVRSRVRVASLMIMRDRNSLFSDSSREPRFTLSPITV